MFIGPLLPTWVAPIWVCDSLCSKPSHSDFEHKYLDRCEIYNYQHFVSYLLHIFSLICFLVLCCDLGVTPCSGLMHGDTERYSDPPLASRRLPVLLLELDASFYFVYFNYLSYYILINIIVHT